MAKLQPQTGAEVVRPANDNNLGEVESGRLFRRFPGNRIGDVHHVAFELGLLVAAGCLQRNRGEYLLTRQLELRQISDVLHYDVFDQFSFGVHQPVSAQDVLTTSEPSSASRFSITWFDEVKETVVKNEVLQGALGLGEFTAIVAKPGTAKSVLMADIGMHISAGRDWHGRKVKQGLVVFFAAERKSLTERRVAAWRKHHGIGNIPFAIIGGKLDLTGPTDAKALSSSIQQLEVKTGQPCVLVIFDTLSRTFGSGDQNTSKDMGKYVASVDEIIRTIGCHVTVIHHSTWNEDRGKGAIDLDGAIDASFVIKRIAKKNVFMFECTGANDRDEGVVTEFALDSIELGVDENGERTTAPVVVEVEKTSATEACAKDKTTLKGQEEIVFAALRDLLLDEKITAVSKEEWKAAFVKSRTNTKPDTINKAFQRYSKTLIEKRLVVEVDGQYKLQDIGQSEDMSR